MQATSCFIHTAHEKVELHACQGELSGKSGATAISLADINKLKYQGVSLTHAIWILDELEMSPTLADE